MSRNNDRVSLRVRSDTGIDADASTGAFSFDRPFKVTDVAVIPVNPADADTDTLAVDVSYSTDGFSTSDVEIAALAALEYNDTTNDLGAAYTRQDVALTTASLDGDGTVRVPADAVIRVTITWTGAPADGIVDVVVNGHAV